MYSSYRGVIQFVETVSACISLVASVYCASRLKKEKNGRYTLTDSMLIVLLIVDIVLSIFFAIGSAGTLNYGFCQFQAVMIQWFSLTGIFWLACNGYQLYKWVVLKKQAHGIRKKLKRYAVACFTLSGIIAFALLGTGKYGDAVVWCWIAPENSTSYWLRFICFYFFLAIAWVYNAMILGAISTTIAKRIEQETKLTGKKSELSTAEQTIRNRLMVYLAIFVFTWFFSLLNGIVEAIAGEEVFFTNLLQALFVPMQGLLNALCYGGILNEDSELHEWLEKNWTFVHELLFPKRVAEVKRRMSVNAAANVRKAMADYDSKFYSIFTTTLNLGEAPFEECKSMLHRWILKGHDIYVVGAQECLELELLRAGILEHLGGASEYCMYQSEIGSNNTSLGFHGYIGLTVYLKASHVAQGSLKITDSAVQTIAAGANLGVYTAANKGGVGFPIQIHDTSIAFVTVHLPSDSKGVSKLAKRNGAACSILHELTLVSNDYGYDSHLQHDHFVFLGDLNYRMEVNANSVSALTGVSIAATIEKTEFQEDTNWLKRKYSLLHGMNSDNYPSREEIGVIHKAQAAAKGAWVSVLAADELRRLLAEDEVFHNFMEPLPAFPPSYKRKKGDASDCGDYTDPIVMIEGFSNTGEVELQEDEDVESGGKQSEVKAPEIDIVFDVKPGEKEDSWGSCEDKNTSVEMNGSSSPGKLSRASSKRGRRQSVVRALPANATKKEIKSIRPPSYTDRILVHSLPDRKDKIKIIAYDMCDELRVSDHRAVSMVMQLEVNSKICSSAAPEGAISKTAFPLSGTSMEFVELIINDTRIELDIEDSNLTNNMTDVVNPMQTKPSTPTRRPTLMDDTVALVSKVHTITIVFPLPSKDPMITYRDMYDLTQALKISSKDIMRSLQSEAMKAGIGSKFNKELLLKPIHSFQWDEVHQKEIRLPGCICPELGAHALLKVADGEGESLGECVIPLTHFLQMNLTPECNTYKLSCGGRVTGSISGTFLLTQLVHSAPSTSKDRQDADGMV